MKARVSLLICLFFVAAFSADARADDKQGSAALVIDVQSCFVEGGSLAVPGANKQYVEDVRKAVRWFRERGFLMLASRDYHPPNHISFASSHPGQRPFTTLKLPDGRLQKLWPDHCVYTNGDARFLVDNDLFYEIIKKGQNRQCDSYSAFTDECGVETELDAILKSKGVKKLVIFGLATDVCVKASVLDALKRGYSATVVPGLSRGVSLADTQNALSEMRLAGARIFSEDFLKTAEMRHTADR